MRGAESRDFREGKVAPCRILVHGADPGVLISGHVRVNQRTRRLSVHVPRAVSLLSA